MKPRYILQEAKTVSTVKTNLRDALPQKTGGPLGGGSILLVVMVGMKEMRVSCVYIASGKTRKDKQDERMKHRLSLSCLV